MTALWIILGIAIYATGFTITVRVVNLLDRRSDWFGDGEDVMGAIIWPLVWLTVAVALPFALLYRLATRDLKGD
jgi:uncharacterized BrkB/YihY/UPF0761 family membrane protein